MATRKEILDRERQMEHINCDQEISRLRANVAELGRCLMEARAVGVSANLSVERRTANEQIEADAKMRRESLREENADYCRTTLEVQHDLQTAEARMADLEAQLCQEREANQALRDDRESYLVQLKQIDVLESQLKAANETIGQLREATSQARAGLERDRTKLADALTKIREAIESRFWLTEGRGCYEWNDDRYREEFGYAISEISEAVKGLEQVATDWRDCPQTSAEVAKARVDLQAQVAQLQATIEQQTAEITRLREFEFMYKGLEK